MIRHEGAIWMVREPVDMRRGLEGLSEVVRQSLGKNPCTDGAFLFRNRAGNRIKILLWDGTGRGSGWSKGGYTRVGLSGLWRGMRSLPWGEMSGNGCFGGLTGGA